MAGVHHEGQHDNLQHCDLKELEKLSVHYDEITTNVSFFVMQLEHVDTRQATMFTNYFTKLARDLLTFSIDLNSALSTGPSKNNLYRTLISEIDNFNKTVEQIRITKNEQIPDNECVENESVLFETFCSRARDFLKYLLVFLRDTKKPNKGQFTQLFMLFSRIFLLDPEVGQWTSKRKLKINNSEVLAVPDILCFLQGPAKEWVTMVATTEMKLSDREINAGDPSIVNILESDVLGCHGYQLLAQSSNSIYGHQVLGCICMQTKVIFTFLDITEEHLESIKTPGVGEGECSNIHYTRPFDFMIAEDRNEVVELFALLGFVQSDAYRFYN